MNPRAAINDLHPFQGCPFGLLGTSPSKLITQLIYHSAVIRQRRGWDSNPRALADKRFSRPPRYDHFDTSPCFCLKRWVVPNLFLLYIEESTNALPSWNLPFVQKFVFLSSAKVIIAKKPLSVNTFFQKFQIIFSKV